MRLFKKINELEQMKEIFQSGVLQELARYLSAEQAKQKEIERNKLIKERYDYLKFRKEKGLDINKEQLSEFEYVSFMIEERKI